MPSGFCIASSITFHRKYEYGALSSAPGIGVNSVGPVLVSYPVAAPVIIAGDSVVGLFANVCLDIDEIPRVAVSALSPALALTVYTPGISAESSVASSVY